MPIVWTILGALATAAGAAASLGMFVLCVAGTPDSTPQQLHDIKLLMAGIAVGGLLLMIGAIVLLVYGRPGWAALVGGLPALVFLGSIVYVALS